MFYSNTIYATVNSKREIFFTKTANFMRFTHCQLLHWSYEKHSVPDVDEHVHSYFQIELCVNGVIKFTSAGKKLRLTAGEWMLIPPGTSHGMVYEGKNLEYYSFKFEVENLPEKVRCDLIYQKRDYLSNWIITTLIGQRPADKYLYMPINENRAVLESLLDSMLQHALSPITPNSGQPELMRNIADLITEEGARINVQNAAEKLHMNLSQLKYRYKLAVQELPPAEHLTLKEFIDHELMRQIDRFLFYSDLSLGEISNQTKFNNIYTFSRFVKRMTGQSPGQRQKQK